MVWNGTPFIDHPPAGFWFQAISFQLLGVSEFSARLPSVIFALLAMVFTYLLGKRLFNRGVGLISAISLSTAIWFAYRARAADLDTFLTCFFVSSIYLALKSCDNKKFLYPFAVSLALLFLTKTGIPIVIVPTLLYVYLTNKKSFKSKELIKPFGLFILIAGSWFLVQYLNNSNFIQNYIRIGFPRSTEQSDIKANFSQIVGYLHMGIGKWFWPSILGLIGGLVLFPRRIGVLVIFCAIFFFPYILTSRGHIWHLIPLYPFMILSFYGFTYLFVDRFTKKPLLGFAIIFVFGSYQSFIQGRQIWYQFIDIPAYVSDEAILSREAGKYPYPFFIDENYGPAAAYYSDKHVQKYSWGSLISFFQGERPYADAKNFTLITTQFRLNDSKIDPKMYKVLKVDRDKILLTLPNPRN